MSAECRKCYRDLDADFKCAACECEAKVENLKMVCRRLANAKTIEQRDKIAKQCQHLFAGNILRTK